MRASHRVWRQAAWGLVAAGLGTDDSARSAACSLLIGWRSRVSFDPWFRAWKCRGRNRPAGALVWGRWPSSGTSGAARGGAGASGVPGDQDTGRLTYLMVLSILAGLVSVLGARNPGGGAWAILMALLVVVFLIPWLEAGGRLHRGQGHWRLQLHSPWTLFYGLLVLAGVTNYLPTRYGPAACAMGAGLVLEYLGLTRPDWSNRGRAPSLAGRGLDPAVRGLARVGLLAQQASRRKEQSGAALALVSRPLGRCLGPPDPGTVQPLRRGGPMAGAANLVRPCARASAVRESHQPTRRPRPRLPSAACFADS